jgi:predicted permease
MIALACGASAAVFSVVDAVILRSPFTDVGEVVTILRRGPDGQLRALDRDEYERIELNLPVSIAAVGVNSIASPIASRIDVPKRTQTICLSESMPAVIGTQPQMGRWFTREEARPGEARVAVVSFNFWRTYLGGDRSAIGRVISLDDVPVTVIGVMPAGFDGPYREVWVPYWPLTNVNLPYDCRATLLVPLARLRAGVSITAATRDLNAAGSNDLVLTEYSTGTTGSLTNPFSALVGAVLAVVLIAFANVANLGLERMAGRQRELAVRLALGATRARIVQEIVAEHILISAAAGLAGIGIAFVSFDATISLLPASLPNLDAVELNTRVLIASLGLTITGGIAAGGLAAWHTSTAAFALNLGTGDRGYTDGRSLLRRVLVTAELALGVLLLVGALLMVRTFLTLNPSDPGFEAAGKHIALFRLPPETPAHERLAFTSAMIHELSAQQGIRAVAATTSVPLRRSVSVRPVAANGVEANAHTGSISPNYLDMMGIGVLRGRGLTADDDAGAPAVAVVNEAFVRRWFPRQEPLGQVLTLGPDANRVEARIVGIIADTRSFGHDIHTRPFVYRPLAQASAGNSFLMLDVDERATAGLMATIRAAVAVVRPGQLVDEVERLRDEMTAEVARPRLGAWLFGTFAGLAVLLGAVGLAATLAWSVAQRRKEIGIRMALGARPKDVSRLVTGQMLAMSTAGIALGLLAASLTTGLLEGWLYGVTPLDPLTFASCGALMLGVSAVAAFVPARRAARVDPAVTLRGDS